MKNFSTLCVALLISGALFGADEAPQNKMFFVINDTESPMTLHIEDGHTEKITTFQLTPGGSAMHPRCVRTFILKGNLELEGTSVIPFEGNPLSFDDGYEGLILSQTKKAHQAGCFVDRVDPTAPLYLMLAKVSHSKVLENLKKDADGCEEPEQLD